MKSPTKIIVSLVLCALIFSMACNLLNAIRPSDETPPLDILIESGENQPEELVPNDTEPIEGEPEPVVEEEPVQNPPQNETVQPGPYAIFVGQTTVTFFNDIDMAPKVVNLNGYVVSVVPSPFGGKVAIVRSENEDFSGMFWFDLLDLATGQVSTITPLANEQTVMNDWETAEIGKPPRGANFATVLSDPVWRPDGSAVVFISAHQGLYARPYSYMVDSATINDLSLTGEAHYYAPSISPNGDYIVVPCAKSFGTGAGLDMDTYWMARVSGGEARIIADVSEASNVLTRGWLDDQTVVFSVGDIIAGGKNLRAVNIITGNMIEITGPNDYVDNVAVGPYTGTILFTTMMEELGDYVDGNTINKNALYAWNIGMQQYGEINDRVTWGSFIEWNPDTNCYYVDQFNGGQEADFVQPYTGAGTINEMTCRPLTANVKNIPDFSATLEYFAWTIGTYEVSAPTGLYVQGFTDNREIRLADIALPFAWHPFNDVLIFAQETRIYQAVPPEFTLDQVLEAPESISKVFWVNP
ncbi:MAG: hypothetical protein V2J07_01185 [Anaerolineae bacterium]|jgi:hypothetical protein|nr:hypothetical protein [Anaerolineae bacterium]